MDRERVRAFTRRIFADMGGAMTAGLAYVGTETGLFRAMQGKGPMRPDEVAGASGLQPRYVEEWLRGMTCAGYLDYDPERETFALPDEHAWLLASDGSDHFVGGLFHMVPALLAVAPQVARAFREGGGVAFEAYGEQGILALDLINRGNYENRLAGDWLSHLPEVVQRLQAGGRALDVGCGTGRVSLALARAFPEARCVGLDVDAESIEHAREAAAEERFGDRVRFLPGALEALGDAEPFDLVTLCDCLHDLVDPGAVLEEIARRLAEGGTLLVIEPRASDRLEDDCHPVGAMFYGFSVFHCMTQSLARGGPGLGTCLGPARITRMLREAGFTEVEPLPIRSQVNLFFAARR